MEQVSLPIKTKIAGTILVIVGILFGLIPLFEFIFFHSALFYAQILGGFIISTPAAIDINFLLLFLTIFFGLLFFISSTFLLTKRKWAWWLSVIILYPILLIFIFAKLIFPLLMGVSFQKLFSYFISPDIIFLVLLLISFVLLRIDRKNFWKIAT